MASLKTGLPNRKEKHSTPSRYRNLIGVRVLAPSISIVRDFQRGGLGSISIRL